MISPHFQPSSVLSISDFLKLILCIDRGMTLKHAKFEQNNVNRFINVSFDQRALTIQKLHRLC